MSKDEEAYRGYLSDYPLETWDALYVYDEQTWEEAAQYFELPLTRLIGIAILIHKGFMMIGEMLARMLHIMEKNTDA